MSDRQAQAKAAAAKNNPGYSPPESFGTHEMREEFIAGVEWADANPQDRAITRTEFEDAYTYWFDGLPSRGRTEDFLDELGIEVEADE